MNEKLKKRKKIFVTNFGHCNTFWLKMTNINRHLTFPSAKSDQVKHNVFKLIYFYFWKSTRRKFWSPVNLAGPKKLFVYHHLTLGMKVQLFGRLFFYFFILYIDINVYTQISIYLPIYLTTYLSISLSIYLSIYLSINIPIFIYIYIYIYIYIGWLTGVATSDMLCLLLL